MTERVAPRRLIVYARCPRAGQAKTRLARHLGAEAAAGLYARLLYRYLDHLASADLGQTEITLALATEEDLDCFRAAYPEVRVEPQVPGDLGHRMATSFARAYHEGAERVILTGSDIPGLDAHLVLQALAALERADVVLGPAEDGGYYLIGQRAPGAPLFEGITWSTDQVLAQTLALVQAQGLTVAHLPTLYDIDTLADYERWRQEARRSIPQGETP